MLDELVERVQCLDEKFDIVPPLVSDLPLSYRSGWDTPHTFSTESVFRDTITRATTARDPKSTVHSLLISENNRPNNTEVDSVIPHISVDTKIADNTKDAFRDFAQASQRQNSNLPFTKSKNVRIIDTIFDKDVSEQEKVKPDLQELQRIHSSETRTLVDTNIDKEYGLADSTQPIKPNFDRSTEKEFGCGDRMPKPWKDKSLQIVDPISKDALDNLGTTEHGLNIGPQNIAERLQSADIKSRPKYVSMSEERGYRLTDYNSKRFVPLSQERLHSEQTVEARTSDEPHISEKETYGSERTMFTSVPKRYGKI